MSDEKALLAGIWASPLDDAPRLVYADWLDEQGGPAQVARAEFIRAQCELELLATYDPRYPVLASRAQALLDTWRAEWVKPLPKKYRGKVLEFWRGFPLPTVKTGKLTDSDLQHAPLWRTPFRSGDTLDDYLKWPLLPQTMSFSLYSTQGDDWVAKVAECDGLRNVTELAFTGCGLTAKTLKVILDAWTDRRPLRHLWVNSCPVGDTGMRLIAKHPATAGLQLLRAHTADITSRGVKAVVDSPNLDRVTLATFAHNPLGETGCKHLLRWKALAGIRELYLMNTHMPPKVADQFRKLLGTRVTL